MAPAGSPKTKGTISWTKELNQPKFDMFAAPCNQHAAAKQLLVGCSMVVRLQLPMLSMQLALIVQPACTPLRRPQGCMLWCGAVPVSRGACGLVSPRLRQPMWVSWPTWCKDLQQHRCHHHP